MNRESFDNSSMDMSFLNQSANNGSNQNSKLVNQHKNSGQKQPQQSFNVSVNDQSSLLILKQADLSQEYDNSQIIKEQKLSQLINNINQLPNENQPSQKQDMTLQNSSLGLGISVDDNNDNTLLKQKQSKYFKKIRGFEEGQNQQQKSQNKSNSHQLQHEQEQNGQKKLIKTQEKGEEMQQHHQQSVQLFLQNLQKNNISQQDQQSSFMAENSQLQQQKSIINKSQLQTISIFKTNNKDKLKNSRQHGYKFIQQKSQQKPKLLQSFQVQVQVQEVQELLQKLQSTQSQTKQQKLLMDRLQMLVVDTLSKQFPQQFAYLKTLLKNDTIQIAKRFKRIFPIKFSKTSLSKHYKHPEKKQRDLYKQYHLQQSKSGLYSKYFILNLSYKRINDIDKITQLNWKNLVEINLKYCHIGNLGWLSIISQLQSFQQLRKINLQLNKITQVSQKDLQRFFNLQHFMELDLRQNPYTIQTWKILLKLKKDNFTKGRFKFQVSRLDYSPKMIKISSFFQLQTEQLKQINEKRLMDKVFKSYNLLDWQISVYFLQCQGDNGIQTFTFQQLELINSHIQKEKVHNKRVTVNLQLNPINQHSIQAVKLFYSVYKWSLLCLQFGQFNKEYHEKRLQLHSIKNQIHHLHKLIIKKPKDEIIIKENRLMLIEDINSRILQKPSSELKQQKYLQEIFDYVIQQIERIDQKKQDKNVVEKLKQQFLDLRENFFTSYHKNHLKMKMEELQ